MNPGAIKTIAYFDLIFAIVTITKAVIIEMGCFFFDVGCKEYIIGGPSGLAFTFHVLFHLARAEVASLLFSAKDYQLIGVGRLYGWVRTASLPLDAFVWCANIYMGVNNFTFLIVGYLFWVLVSCSYLVAVLTLLFKLKRNRRITNSSLQSTEG